ncbi:hypothetical protein RIF29_34297 [Crotalaria pallida]|uniref:Uncharacterized protein n=1 Tax=Crotalaria pallida TaxID=3830 RepID=A0AAN9HXB6_CROPI
MDKTERLTKEHYKKGMEQGSKKWWLAKALSLLSLRSVDLVIQVQHHIVKVFPPAAPPAAVSLELSVSATQCKIVDWKIVVISLDDPKPSLVNDVDDVEKPFPFGQQDMWR